MEALLNSKTTLIKTDSRYFVIGKNIEIRICNDLIADLYTDDCRLIHSFTEESKLSDFLNSLDIK